MNNMKESFMKNKTGIVLILISALFSCSGQFLWKLSGMQSLWLLFFGFVCYGMGMLFMLLAYRHGSLSVLHPMLSVGYVFSLILAATVLKEAVSPIRILGVAVILVGVIFIGGGDD